MSNYEIFIREFCDKLAFELHEVHESKYLSKTNFSKLNENYIKLSFEAEYTTSLGDTIKIEFVPNNCRINGLKVSNIQKEKDEKEK